METDLRRALEREELVLFYQPIVSLASGRLEGFEALLRWKHPEKGLVLPNSFIPLAEETGLIVPIGWATLQQACRQIQTWRSSCRAARDLSISVNISGKEFDQPDLVTRVSKTLDESHLEPQSLRLEMTESMIMKDAEAAVDTLHTLRGVGVQLHIDDFGTGYSSLSYLQRLPTHAIKIDRSFVHGMSNGNGQSEIIGTIVSLARNLNMGVSAEGLETAEQLEQLRTMDCELGQGYLFSRPLDATSAGSLIASQPRW
jgi:EAL domain-containing protein (putative c-di-GMP-specific phosphodiesterase class I)